MKWIVLIGRLLYSLIFLGTTLTHFSAATIQGIAAGGLPMAGFLVPAAGVLAILGAISIVLGYKARLGAWLLVLFLVPVTLVMHHFWTFTDPMQHQLQKIQFMKNLSLLGSGPLSISPANAGRRQENSSGASVIG
jgi:putative oxidoreductase